jgi:hypothetical protein
MSKPSLRLCAVLLFAALTAQASLTQQPPANREIRAHIIDGSTGDAIQRVRFTLTGGGLLDGLAGNGDNQGDLTVSAPPGKYRLTVEKAGYFPEVYDLNFTASSSSTLPEIVLTAKREISGTVRWQDGEVATRAEVRVFGVRGGKPIPRGDISAVQTNDRGEFIVGNLRPGRYILLVSPPTFLGGFDAAGRFAEGGVPRLAFAVFYPGVNVPDVRSAIDVRGALNAQNITIVFEEKQGTTIEGTIAPSATVPMGTAVTLTLANQGLYTVTTSGRAGEPFRIGPVPSGLYVLDASSQGGQPGRVLIPLTIGGATFRGVAVSIPPPAFLAGRVEIDDSAIRPSANMTLQSDKVQGTVSGSVGATGEFRIARVVAGETYNMTVDPRSLPPNAYIAAVNQAGQQLSASPFQVIGGGEPVQLVLRTDSGTIEGTVKDAGRPVGQAFVVLAPKDRQIQQNFRTTAVDAQGAFKLTAIPPGDYDLFAFDRNEDDDYLDEVFLQGYADRAAAAKIAPRSNQMAALTVLRIPRR